jgi:hypothetical protein
MVSVLRSATAATLGGVSLFATGVVEAGPAVMLNPYYHGHADYRGAVYDSGTPHVVAYWYGHGTPGPGYWAGYAPAFAFPSIHPAEYYPAYGNGFGEYRGTLYRGPIDAAPAAPRAESCPCERSIEGGGSEFHDGH